MVISVLVPSWWPQILPKSLIMVTPIHFFLSCKFTWVWFGCVECWSCGPCFAQIDENVYRKIINHRLLWHPNIIQFIEVRIRNVISYIVYYSPFVCLGLIGCFFWGKYCSCRLLVFSCDLNAWVKGEIFHFESSFSLTLRVWVYSHILFFLLIL